VRRIIIMSTSYAYRYMHAVLKNLISNIQAPNVKHALSKRKAAAVVCQIDLLGRRARLPQEAIPRLHLHAPLLSPLPLDEQTKRLPLAVVHDCLQVGMSPAVAPILDQSPPGKALQDLLLDDPRSLPSLILLLHILPLPNASSPSASSTSPAAARRARRDFLL